MTNCFWFVEFKCWKDSKINPTLDCIACLLAFNITYGFGRKSKHQPIRKKSDHV